MHADGQKGAPREAGAVLLLDDNPDLLDVLECTVVEVCARGCVAAKSLDEFRALGDRALDCDVAILDVNLGPDQPNGIDAYEWLRSHGFHGRIAFLTGHARTHPAVERACRVEAAHVYQKPISLDQLRSIVGGAPA